MDKPAVTVAVRREGDDEWILDAQVYEGEDKTEHAVTVERAYYHELTGGKIPVDELVRRSFVFLLRNESKESILREFDLRQIRDYFPGYEREMIESVGDLDETDVEVIPNK